MKKFYRSLGITLPLLLLAMCVFAETYTKVPLWGGDVQVLAVGPSNPDILYAGSAYCGSYVSKDGGATWASIEFPGTYGNSAAGTIAIHPTSANIVLAGSWGVSGFIMRSEDYGENWTNVGENISGLSSVSKIVASKVTTGTFYLLGREDTGYTAVVYTSADSGVTWGSRKVVTTNCTAKDMDVDSSDNIFVTIMTDTDFYGSDHTGSLWKSTAGGDFAKIRDYDFRPDLIQIRSNTLLVNIDANSNQPAGACCDISNNTGTSFISSNTITNSKTQRYLSPNGDKLYYYSSYALHVSSTPNWNSYSVVCASTPISYTQIGAKLGMLVPVPQDATKFYLTNSELGIIKSVDGGATWTAANNGMGGVVALDGCKDPNGDMYIIGNITLYKGTNIGAASESWVKVFCPDEVYGSAPRVGGIVTAPTASVVLYAARSDLYRSADSGVTWSNVLSLSGASSQDQITGIEFNKNNTNICYISYSSGTVSSASSSKYIYKSTDTGASWTALNFTGSSVQSLEIDPVDPTIIYAGIGDSTGYGGSGIDTYGGMWKIVDDNVSTPVKTELSGLSSYRPSKIASDTDGAIFCVCDSGSSSESVVMYSADQGTTWNAANYSGQYITDIAFSEGVYYIAKQEGIYASESLAEEFTEMADNDDLGTIQCLVMGSMYGGANSGLYKLSFAPVISSNIKTYNYPNPFNPKTSASTTIRYLLKEIPDELLVKIYSLAGELVYEYEETTIDGTVTWDAKNDSGNLCAPGIYFCVIDADGDKIRNKIVIVY